MMRVWLSAAAALCLLLPVHAEEHLSYTFERNIVYYRSGKLLSGSWGDDRFAMEGNLYWDERWGSGVRARSRAGEPDFGGAALRRWQRRGHDRQSVLRDPLFVDAGAGDFGLRSGSPALRLGFRQIDLSSVGPRVRPDPS